MKGMYFEKDLGDGTRVSVVRIRREDDGNWALAFRWNFDGKVLTCFLEDVDGECFVDELTDVLVQYLEDKGDEAIEESEEKALAFVKRKKAEEDKRAPGDEILPDVKREKKVETR